MFNPSVINLVTMVYDLVVNGDDRSLAKAGILLKLIELGHPTVHVKVDKLS